VAEVDCTIVFVDSNCHGAPQAAAMFRARHAIAGGLVSTVTGAGNNQAAFTGANTGAKTLLGQ
jgi:hypothetical protein